MANTPPSPTASERTHKLKTYLNKLQLPLPTKHTHPFPRNTTRPKGDDSILEKRIKLKLTGDAKPGSHSACWGLTPDGQTHEAKYVDVSEISGAVDFSGRAGEEAGETVKMGQ